MVSYVRPKYGFWRSGPCKYSQFVRNPCSDFVEHARCDCPPEKYMHLEKHIACPACLRMLVCVLERPSFAIFGPYGAMLLPSRANPENLEDKIYRISNMHVQNNPAKMGTLISAHLGAFLQTVLCSLACFMHALTCFGGGIGFGSRGSEMESIRPSRTPNNNTQFQVIMGNGARGWYCPLRDPPAQQNYPELPFRTC